MRGQRRVALGAKLKSVPILTDDSGFSMPPLERQTTSGDAWREHSTSIIASSRWFSAGRPAPVTPVVA